MRDAWLFEVLRDIEDYSIAHEMEWLVPLINKINVSARAEEGRRGRKKSVTRAADERNDLSESTDIRAAVWQNFADLSENHNPASASQNPSKPISMEKAYSQSRRMSAALDAEVKARSVWQFTPTALAQLCMISDGKGGHIGDEIYQNRTRPYLLGCPVEIETPQGLHESRFSLVDPLADDVHWHYLHPLVADAGQP